MRGRDWGLMTQDNIAAPLRVPGGHVSSVDGIIIV